MDKSGLRKSICVEVNRKTSIRKMNERLYLVWYLTYFAKLLKEGRAKPLQSTKIGLCNYQFAQETSSGINLPKVISYFQVKAYFSREILYKRRAEISTDMV